MLIVVLAFFLIAVALAMLGTRIRKKWDAVSMYNTAACLVVSSIIAGTISFLALWLALPNVKGVGYTHQDVVVDIFGVLVTVLMGWNIISVVDIKRKAEKIDCISEDLENVISGIIQLSIHSFTLRPDKDAIIDSCFITLGKVLECDNESVRKAATKEILDVLHNVKQSYKEGENVYIYKDRKLVYQYVLSKVDGVYKNEIEDWISFAQESIDNTGSYMFADNSQEKHEASGNYFAQ